MAFTAVVGLSSAPPVGASGTSAPAMAHRDALPAGFTIDTKSREDVRVLYNTIYDASNGVPMGWTGNLATCNAGTVSGDFLAATLQRTNYFRVMAGVPQVVFTDANNATAQAAALMQSANGDQWKVDGVDVHRPPTTWRCFTQQGFDGSGASNLSIGSSGPTAIDGLVYDGSALGHRINMLAASLQEMGSGSVDGPRCVCTGAGTEAQLVFGRMAATRPATRDPYVAWPPNGFLPYQLAPARWSLMLSGADFTNATVSMRPNDGDPTTTKDLAITIRSRNGGFAEPAIVWSPNVIADGASWPKPDGDTSYSVKVENVIVNGVARNFNYTVTLFDPSVAGADTKRAAVTGPRTMTVGADNRFSFSAVPNATGYQWRATRLSLLNLTDGAEGGLANFDANVGNYNPVDTTVFANGAAGFRLNRGASPPGPNSQTLTFKNTLLANNNSRITFKSREVFMKALAARVEVSTNGGATWTPVYEKLGADDVSESTFSDKTVPMGAFAGRFINVRFSLTYVGPGGNFCCSNLLGWYLDDIGLLDWQQAAVVSTSPVITDLTNRQFTFNPPDQADYQFQARPQYFGQFFGEWGPMFSSTSVTTGPTAPDITRQPRAQTTVAPGANVNLSVGFTGSDPMGFIWKKDGAALTDGPNVQGSATASLSLLNVTPDQAGSYTVDVGNGLGTVTSLPAVVNVNVPTVAAALDAPGLTFTTPPPAALPLGKDAPDTWFPQTKESEDGQDAAQSGAITDGQKSIMETSITGPATLSFYWKVSSEQDGDVLSFQLDGVDQFSISGKVDWTQETVEIPEGTHGVRWVYTKNGADAAHADAGWVDQVEVTYPEPLPPDLPTALDTVGLEWTTNESPWFGQTDVDLDGADAAQSGAMADGQASTMYTSVVGPATIGFYWKVDSETDFDFLSVQVDGITIDQISGYQDWAVKSFDVKEGVHTITWVYAKDSSTSAGADAGWVDNVTVTPVIPAVS